MNLTIGSLFAGVGGIELGLELAGLGQTLFQVEIDPFCRSVLAKHWPHAYRGVEDVHHANRYSLPPVDVLCGGFPCTNISVAGRREGIDGPQSGLWREYARFVGETRPKIVLVENVARLVAHGLDRVVGDLEGHGYRVYGHTVRASDVGAPHKRERLFVVAYRIGGEHLADTERERHEGFSSSRLHGGGQPGHDAPRCGEVVADSDGVHALGGRNASAGLDEARSRSSSDVADTAGARHEGRIPDALEGRTRSLQRSGSGESLADSECDGVRHIEQWGSWRWARAVRHAWEALARDIRTKGGRATESRMGQLLDGFSRNLDEWPASPGEAQKAWEPPRTKPRAVKGSPPNTRRLQLKALGNAVVPHCILYEVAPFIRALLEAA